MKISLSAGAVRAFCAEDCTDCAVKACTVARCHSLRLARETKDSEGNAG